MAARLAELATIGAGYLGYALARLAIHADRHAAFAHAAQLWQAERRMHLRIEPWLNRLAAARPALAEAAGDLVAEPLPGEDLRGDLLRLAGAGRLDPTMAPAAWKMALSRSPLPRGSVEST
jgi:hypothetical protein